jgi:hypothetical protein
MCHDAWNASFCPFGAVVCGGTAHPNMASLAASHNKDYTNDDENEPENENKPIDYSVDRPLAAAE